MDHRFSDALREKIQNDGQILDMPQATRHPVIHPGVDKTRSRHQHERTKVDGHTVTYEAKKNLTVQNSMKATKAVKKAKAQHDNAKKIKAVEVEKAFMTSEARVNHAMVVMEASKTRIAKSWSQEASWSVKLSRR